MEDQQNPRTTETTHKEDENIDQDMSDHEGPVGGTDEAHPHGETGNLPLCGKI